MCMDGVSLTHAADQDPLGICLFALSLCVWFENDEQIISTFNVAQQSEKRITHFRDVLI
jgi:hypothetical protein